MVWSKAPKLEMGWSTILERTKEEKAYDDFLMAVASTIIKREWGIEKLYESTIGPLGTSKRLHPDETRRAEQGAEIFWDFLLDSGVPLLPWLEDRPKGIWASDLGEIAADVAIYGDDEPLLVQDGWVPISFQRYNYWREPTIMVLDGTTIPEQEQLYLINREHGVLLDTPRTGRHVQLGALYDEHGPEARYLEARLEDEDTWFPYRVVGPVIPFDMPDASFLAGKF